MPDNSFPLADTSRECTASDFQHWASQGAVLQVTPDPSEKVRCGSASGASPGWLWCAGDAECLGRLPTSFSIYFSAIAGVGVHRITPAILIKLDNC